jgi:hypothetical protein
MIANLYRYAHDKKHTLGIFIIQSQVFWTIERAWQDNKVNESCIPMGEYDVEFLPKSRSGKYKNCYYLTKVPGRSGILIHNGNLAIHSKGCIILGTRAGKLAGQPAVLNSKSAMRELNRITGTEPFTLRIF